MGTDLQIIENKVIQSMPVALQAIVKARFGNPISSYTARQLAFAAKDIVIVAHAEMGINLTEEKSETVTFLRETLVKDFQTAKFQPLSLESIRLFISNGIRGQYGTFKNQLNTINIQNIHHWINEGLKSDDYKRSVTEFNKKLDAEESETKRSKEPVYYSPENLTVMCKNAFEDYKKNQSLPIPGAAAVFYEHIKTTLKVETLIDLLDWENIQNEAKRWYLAQLKEARSKKDTTEIKPDYRLPDKDGNGGNKAYGFHVKRIALKYYFDTLLSNGEGLGI